MLSGVVSKAGAYGMLRFALPLFPGPAADCAAGAAHGVARRPALVLARRVPPARLARRDRVLVDRADEPDHARDLRLQRPGRHRRDVPDGQPRPALGAALPARRLGRGALRQRASSRASARSPAAGPRSRRSASRPASRRSPCPGRACSPRSSSCCWAPSASSGWSARSRRSRSCSRPCTCCAGSRRSCTTRPREPTSPASADAGGIRDLRWEAVWLVPLVAAVLALSAYPYFVTHRVDASVHALDRAGGARGRPSDPDARSSSGRRSRPSLVLLGARVSAAAAQLASCRARSARVISGTISIARRSSAPALLAWWLWRHHPNWLVMSGQLRVDRFADLVTILVCAAGVATVALVVGHAPARRAHGRVPRAAADCGRRACRLLAASNSLLVAVRRARAVLDLAVRAVRARRVVGGLARERASSTSSSAASARRSCCSARGSCTPRRRRCASTGSQRRSRRTTSAARRCCCSASR